MSKHGQVIRSLYPQILSRIAERHAFRITKRQWISELQIATEIDNEMKVRGLLDPDKDITTNDMFRQTYASDSRAGHFFYRGPIDGSATGAMSEAIFMFQEKNALRRNGRLDNETLAELNLLPEPANANPLLKPFHNPNRKREPAVLRLTFTGETAASEAFSENTELFYRGFRINDDDPNSPDGSPLRCSRWGLSAPGCSRCRCWRARRPMRCRRVSTGNRAWT